MDVDHAPVSERRASHPRVMDHSEGNVSSPKGKGKSRESTGGPSKSPKVDGVPRVKLTFRPSVNNLIHDANTPPSYPNMPASDRSSLSPPPPITLKFGLHQRSSLAEKASYSSSSGSSDDDSEAEAVAQTSNPRPKKKARPTPKSPTHTKLHPPPHTLDTGSDATGHRKSYDWLEPSVAGASHHGPPDRGTPKITGWVPEDDIKPEDLDSGKKKSHKKKPGGPGKAWRKGIKKSMLMSWKDGGGSEDGRGGTSTPGDATPRSMGGSPEPAMADAPPAVDTSTPFVPADAKALGFPVFSKPIVAPKLNLGAFPRVTTYFWLNNGGDVGKFPRKEKVRSWTSTERTLVGIGGGQLKFKTWGMGPQSELGRLVQADKEAKDQARLKSKAAAAAALAESSAEVPARPVLVTGTSFESVAPQEHPVDDAHGADGVSEIGDGEESVASAGQSASPSVAKPKARPAKSKPPRKSKLAQEIHPVDSTTAIEDVI